jgi:hypothetical protein
MVNFLTTSPACGGGIHYHFETSEPNEDHRMICFGEGATLSFSKELLMKCEYFFEILQYETPTLNGIPFCELQNCTSEEFKIIWSIAVEPQIFEDVSHSKCWSNPHLYEKLSRLLPFFFRETYEKRLAELKNIYKLDLESYLKSHMTEALAIEVLKNNGDFESVSSLPIWVQIAYHTLTQSIGFINKEEAEKNCSHRIRLAHTLLGLRKELLIAESAMNSLGYQREADSLIKSKIHHLTMQKGQYEAQQIFLFNASISEVPHRYVEFAQSPYPFMQKIAAEALADAEKYKIRTLAALQRSGARMDRQDLLEYIVGPKGYLLERYNIRLKDYRNDSRPFTYGTLSPRGIHMTYSLENPSLFDFEQELRKDVLFALKDRGVDAKLPLPLFTEQAVTIPMTPEVMEMQKNLIPKIGDWKNLSESIKREVVDQLFSYNGWDEIFSNCKVDPNDFMLDFRAPLGTGLFINRVTSAEYPFRMSFHNFLLVIEDDKTSVSDSRYTKNLLTEILRQLNIHQFFREHGSGGAKLKNSESRISSQSIKAELKEPMSKEQNSDFQQMLKKYAVGGKVGKPTKKDPIKKVGFEEPMHILTSIEPAVEHPKGRSDGLIGVFYDESRDMFFSLGRTE